VTLLTLRGYTQLWEVDNRTHRKQLKMKGGQGMLTITVGATEFFNEETGAFELHGGYELQLEHSLVSLSKWESIHEVPFLEAKDKTPEQINSYIECMVVTPNPPGDFLEKLSKENGEEITAHIDRKMTATWFSETQPQTQNREIITAELIYYWMTVFKIPFECERWHLNRLFTLIRIASLKQEKPKKMSRAQIAQRNREINERRKAQLGTNG
jgi:hypothetical protein